MFLFLLLLLFHSCSSFSTVPLFHLLYYSISIGLDKGGYPVNIFLISPQKHVVGTRGGASNEYPQHMFSRRNKKNINTFGLKKSALTSAVYLVSSFLWETTQNDPQRLTCP